MRPALNQQVNTWDNLFPFEQKRAADFLEALAPFEPHELDNIVYPLRELERKMDVARWNFSTASDTMTNASQLARSPYYADWRREIQRVFTSIQARERLFGTTLPLPPAIAG